MLSSTQPPSHSAMTHKRSNMVSMAHLKKSLPNKTNKVLNQLFSWQRLRKVKSMDFNESVGNVCVIMKSEQSTRTVNRCDNRSVTESFHSQTSVTPAVTFINRGEGLVSMQLMDRIMINDNQLYSMGLSHYPLDSPPEPKPQLVELSPLDLSNDYSISAADRQWFYGSLDRQSAVKLLSGRPVGSFVVRQSSTEFNCFALTVRVPNDYQISGIAHYLIAATERGFRIQGFTKEFASLSSLIVHHSIMQELLPCPLLLPNRLADTTPAKEDNNQLTAFDINNQYFDDILVDIDSDPNYQKVLIKFRKNMYQLIH